MFIISEKSLLFNGKQLYNYFMYQIPSAFNDFISPDCNRLDFILDYLNQNNIDTAVLPIKDKKHVYVKFPKEQYNPSYRIKTVIAHYDREENSPGANDNSAAVFSLLEWAVRLNARKSFHNIRLIFTDGEEEGENGISEQGAFELGKLFKKLSIVNDDIIVFDCTGRGNVPVICENNFSESVPQSFVRRYNEVQRRVQKIIQKAAEGKWFSLKTNYSDNAGFIANGIPAVAVTFLPSDEISCALKGEKPYTWQLFHTEADNISSLTPDSFILMQKILCELEEMKTLL